MNFCQGEYDAGASFASVHEQNLSVSGNMYRSSTPKVTADI
jgi:hypothetical protein